MIRTMLSENDKLKAENDKLKAQVCENDWLDALWLPCVCGATCS